MANEREEENLSFRAWLKGKDGNKVDVLVQKINEEIAPKIDCTQCGACCRQLMINVTETDADRMALHLKMNTETFKEKFVEEGNSMMIMNCIPCHFLKGNKCKAYESRFTECREFPNLDKPGFNNRLFATQFHYGMCPIIFNVIEKLKQEMGFKRKH